MHYRPAYTKDADRILYNWSGLQYLGEKSNVVYPRSEQELVEIMKRFRKIRIVGTALSYEPINSVATPRDFTKPTSGDS